MKARLDKTIADQGTASRSEIKTLIRKGMVLVNGILVKDPGYSVNWEEDQITVSGKTLCLKKHIYLMLNKPQGVVSATDDPRFPTVVDLVPDEFIRKGLFPAGRLDKDTRGFVLITDDGEFAHNILSPKKHVPKTYLARLDGSISQEMILAFQQGVNVNDEYITLPASLRVVETSPTGDLGEVILYEGMYHQIKRMFKAFGRTVVDLQRIRLGCLNLDSTLAEGQCRELTNEELALIKQPLEKLDKASGEESEIE